MSDQPLDMPALQGRSSRIPLWLQLKTAIADMIVQRGLQPDDKLPSETDLCNQFGVSRIVVRQAMSQLVTEGLVYRQQGRGAFVAQQSEDSDFVGRIIGFSGDIRSRNHQVSRTILAADIREPDAKAAKALGLGPDDKVVYLRRIMSVDGVPRILVHSVLPEALVPGLLDHALEDRSLYALLLELYGITFEGAERWVEAVNASAEEAAHLQIRKGTALIKIESRSTIRHGRYAEYFSALYRTDAARLHFTIRPDHTA